MRALPVFCSYGAVAAVLLWAVDPPGSRWDARFGAAGGAGAKPAGSVPVYLLTGARLVRSTGPAQREAEELDARDRYELEVAAGGLRLAAEFRCPLRLAFLRDDPGGPGELRDLARFALQARVALPRRALPVLVYRIRTEPQDRPGGLTTEEQSVPPAGRVTRTRAGDQPVSVSGISAQPARGRELAAEASLEIPAGAGFFLARDDKRIVVEFFCEGSGAGGNATLTLLLTYARS